MNRRKLFGLLAALPFVGIPAIAEPVVGGTISILDIGDDTNYRHFRSYSTEKEAIAFVQSLIPELLEVRFRDVINTEHNSIRSGYRGAIRVMYKPTIEISSMIVGIRSTITDEWIDLAPKDFWIYSIEFAWLLISNIRVNDKPVHLKGVGYKLPNLLSMPFKKGNPTMTKVD